MQTDTTTMCVQRSGAQLDRIGMASSDIVAALQRAEHSNAVAGRSMLAMQMLFAAVASGRVEDREQALRYLETAMQQQCAALEPQDRGAPRLVRAYVVLVPQLCRGKSHGC